MFLFDEAERILSAIITVLALQSNLAALVLTNNGTLGVEIKELKPGVAAPVSHYIRINVCRHMQFFKSKKICFLLETSQID